MLFSQFQFTLPRQWRINFLIRHFYHNSSYDLNCILPVQYLTESLLPARKPASKHLFCKNHIDKKSFQVHPASKRSIFQWIESSTGWNDYFCSFICTLCIRTLCALSHKMLPYGYWIPLASCIFLLRSCWYKLDRFLYMPLSLFCICFWLFLWFLCTQTLKVFCYMISYGISYSSSLWISFDLIYIPLLFKDRYL